MNDRKSSDSLNIGLVGCGRIAQAYLQCLQGLPDLALTGVADVRSDAAESVASQYETKAHSDFRQLVDGVSLDAVIICTPPDTHVEVAEFFLDRGVHVLCEKPLTIGSTEAKKIVAKAEASGRVLMMASKFRYVDDVIKAKGIIDSGILGTVILFENVFCSKVGMQDRWNADREVSGGGVLIDNGTHSVDIARYLLGPIAYVQAEEGRRVQSLDVEDTCRLYLRTQSGTMGAIDLSWSISKERDAFIEIFGPEGALSIGWRGSKYRQSEKLDWVPFGNGYDKVSAFTNQLKNFAGTIHGREAPLISLEDSLASVDVIEAAYRSMSMNKWLPVEGSSGDPRDTR